MKTFQEWCMELLPIVQAGAEGKEIEWSKDSTETWYSYKDADPEYLSFVVDEQYRIKHKD